MRELHVLGEPNLVTPADSPTPSNPFAHAVYGQDGRFFEGRAQKSAGGVREVMLSKQDLLLWNSQLRFDLGSHPELVDEPGDHRLAKHFVRLGIGLKDRHQDPVEFSK